MPPSIVVTLLWVTTLSCTVLLVGCRENIEKDIELERRRAENPDLMEDDVDAVPCISR